MKIGLIREGKTPSDSRVVLTPEQCANLISEKEVDLVVQKSDVRCFTDEEYRALGVPVADDISDCDLLLGVKEVPVERLISDKTYFFFSHTIKKQSYNRPLLQEVLKKNIRLIDYEVLTDENRKRLIAFGVFAGMVGAHNALLTYGRRTGTFTLGRMKDAHDYREVKDSYPKISWPPVKIILTGKGRVGQGAARVLDDMGIVRVSPDDFLQREVDHATYTQIDYEEYVTPKKGTDRTLREYFDHPDDFEINFAEYTAVSDIMINGIFWDNRAPAFFTKEDMRDKNFKIQVIADVTCDIAPVSSIPSTLKAATIADPIFGYDPVTEQETEPYQPQTVDMMTIDNLPNELPRDASTSFGTQFLENIWPEIAQSRFDTGILLRGTVASEGELGPYFTYLEDYALGKD